MGFTIVVLLLQSGETLKLSPVPGTKSSSRQLDLSAEIMQLRSSFLHGFAVVEAEWDSIEWNDSVDIFASDRLGSMKKALDRWNAVSHQPPIAGNQCVGHPLLTSSPFFSSRAQSHNEKRSRKCACIRQMELNHCNK